MQRNDFIPKDIRSRLESQGHAHLPGVIGARGGLAGSIGADEEIGRPSAVVVAGFRTDLARGGIVHHGPFQRCLVDRTTSISGSLAGCKVGEDRAFVDARPAVPVHANGLASADSGMSSDGFGVFMASDIRCAVVAAVDPALVGCIVRPDDAVG